ncbi:MAG TPA: hypothetical protein VFP13_05395 [Actinomycetota bacterium]|nr:hypothetical protein [Actinomycetota bacterium]
MSSPTRECGKTRLFETLEFQMAAAAAVAPPRRSWWQRLRKRRP